MKILIVTRENAADKKYGLGKSIQRIATELENNNHKVDYFSQTECQEAHNIWQPRLIKLLSPLGVLAGAFSERLVQGWMSAKKVRQDRYTHIWFQDPWLVFGFRLYNYITFSSTKHIAIGISEHGLGSFAWAVTQDGLAFSPKTYRKLINYEKKVLLNSDWVWTPSKPALTALLRDLHIAECPKHFEVIHYGRPDDFHNQKPFHPLHNKGINHTPTIIAMGRIAPVKNYTLLIDMIAELQSRFKLETQLVILGEGDSASLLHHAQKAGIAHTPIIKTTDNIYTELEQADIYVSACGVESFGMANREAIAFGLPSIVAAGGGTCEVVGQGAWLLPADKLIFANAIHSLLTNPDLLEFWSTQAKQASEQWPDWKLIYKKYEQTLLAVTK